MTYYVLAIVIIVVFFTVGLITGMSLGSHRQAKKDDDLLDECEKMISDRDTTIKKLVLKVKNIILEDLMSDTDISDSPDDCVNRKLVIDRLTLLLSTLKGMDGDLGSAINGAREIVKSVPSSSPERDYKEVLTEIRTKIQDIPEKYIITYGHFMSDEVYSSYPRRDLTAAECKENVIEILDEYLGENNITEDINNEGEEII